MNKEKILKYKKYKSTETYKSFKNNILNAFHLYGRVFTQKFSKSDNELIRKMYITYLVSCLENYFTELFKEMYDKNMLDRKKIFKIKRIKQLKFNIKDLQNMQDKNVSIAENLVDYMNFQNMHYIYEFAQSIEFNKYSQIVRSNLKKEGSDRSQEIKEILTLIARQKNKRLDNLKISKAISKHIIEYMADDKILLDMYSADKCFNTISRMVKLRHGIIHRAKNVKIEHWEIWAYTMATFQFSNMFYRIYQVKIKELKDKKPNEIANPHT